MKDLLGSAGRAALASLQLPGTLVVLDFDGTLAPLVRDRTRARLPARTRSLLAAVAGERPVAVLSGRAAGDLASRVQGVPLGWIVGGHGAEWPGEPAPRGLARRVAAWRGRIEARLARTAGIDLEDKEVSLSIHWRGAREPRAAERAVRRATADLAGARLVGGKRVLNVVPADAPDKGDALARLVRESRCARVLFVGDDVTDESGFRARLEVPAVMVRVGRSARSAAPWFVGRREDVDELLTQLAKATAEAGEPPASLGPELDFMRAIWALEHGLERRSKAMERRLGVTGPQRLAIRVIGTLGPMTPGRLARVLHLHPASATRLAHALERRGMLRRHPDPHDRRRLRLELGPGARRVERVRAGTLEETVREVLSRQPAADVAAARALVERLADALQQG